MDKPEYAVLVILVLAFVLVVSMYFVGYRQGQADCPAPEPTGAAPAAPTTTAPQ